jgi:hypothetical protein
MENVQTNFMESRGSNRDFEVWFLVVRTSRLDLIEADPIPEGDLRLSTYFFMTCASIDFVVHEDISPELRSTNLVSGEII